MKKNFLLFLCTLLFVFNASAQSIFADDYAPGITFTPFDGSVNTLAIDPSTFHSGTASLKIPVTTGYTGGALMAAVGQNLSAYNAVTFWAKNDRPAFKLDAVGFGDNVTTKVYACERNGVTLTTTWTKYYIPIPDGSLLTAEKSLFHFAEGSGEGAYNIWLDDIQLENVGGGIIGTPTATFNTETQTKEVGQTFGANGQRGTYPVNGVGQLMQIAKPFFTWLSSNTSVASFDALGTGSALAVGTTAVTAKLGLVDATGTLSVNVIPAANPTTPAPTPTRLPADVKSLFSNAYTNVAVETWSTSWSSSNHSYTELQIAGNDTKKYDLFHFAGVEFIGAPVDATVYGFMHIDILCTQTGKSLQIRLVDFNAPNKEATVTKATTKDVWVSYDIPITDFTTLTTKSKISQILFLVAPGQTGTFFIDNVYFYKTPSGGGGGTPLTIAAPIPPTRLPADVISIFSGAYTDLAATNFNPPWSQSTVVTDTTIAGDLTKKYANFNYQGMEFANPINASTMTRLHIDIWSADATGVKVFPIVAGQPEQSVTLTIAAGWNSFDIDLTQYTIPLSSIIQIKMESIPFGGTNVYFDNLYFYKPAAPVGLTVAAPTPPSRLPADVISIFSGAYTDLAATNFNPPWSQSTVVTDTTIAGDLTKKYANFNYQGMEFANPINASAMSRLHIDIWSANATGVKVFPIVAGQPEQSVTLTIAAGWNSFDIDLTQYTIPLSSIIQIKMESIPFGGTNVYFDNLYFYKSTAPTVSITAPAANASFTAPATVTIDATATANNSGTITKVEFYIDAIKVGEDLTAPYSFTATNVLGGTRALTAKATDNDLQTTTSAAVNIIVAGPSGDGYCGQSFNGDYKYRAETEGGIVTFTMHPLTPIQGSLYAIINIKEGSGGFAGYNVTSIGPDFTFSRAIADGTPIEFYYTYQTPPGGERNSLDNPHSYTVGSNCTGLTGIPTVSILTPANNASYTEPASISFTTAAADNDGTVSKVDFFAGRTLIGTSTTAPFSFDWTNVPAGNYNIAARITDNANLTTYSKLIRVTVGIDNSVGFCGTLANGDYSYRVETVGGNVIFTFHPLAPIVGSNNAIIYVREGLSGGYPGYGMTAVGTDFRFTKAIADGTPLSIYFTYNTPLEGGERNSAATPHSYTVGTICTPVLPVTLLSFTAARQANGTVAINWSTAAEFNNDRFLVERSIDGRTFTTIATVAANTNASITSNYSALDRSPVFGLNYYRLTQVDKDGKKTVYAVKTVNIKKANGGISVYPNPVKGNIINIKVADVIDSRLNVQLLSVDGKVIYSGTNVQRGDALQVRLNAIPTAGVYLLKVGTYAPIKIIMN